MALGRTETVLPPQVVCGDQPFPLDEFWFEALVSRQVRSDPDRLRDLISKMNAIVNKPAFSGTALVVVVAVVLVVVPIASLRK
ncbi:MAG: hypothetical protein CBD18_04325 [Opitutales bacterium TMED158]|nr:MAG: hypothetical protein CBD18_04325 [Opitutales bacterium TMED158]